MIRVTLQPGTGPSAQLRHRTLFPPSILSPKLLPVVPAGTDECEMFYQVACLDKLEINVLIEKLCPRSLAEALSTKRSAGVYIFHNFPLERGTT